jgi:nicotinamide-nucleotide amidase
VSPQVASAMADGALARFSADTAVAITGIAGPGGGSAEKPVGLVHFAAAARDGRLIHREKRYGDAGRSEIRRASVIEALDLLLEIATDR